MKEKNNWKNKCVILALTAALTLGCALQTGASDAWAAPSGGTVKIESINVRDGANGTPVASLKKGAKVSIEDEQQGSDGFTWYQVTYDDGGAKKSGWVRSDLLDTTDSADTGTQSSDDTQVSPGGSADSSGDGTDSTEGEGIFSLGDREFAFTESIPSDQVPRDFDKTTITYLGVEVPALKHSQGNMFLLYLKPTSDEGETALYVFDQERESILPFIKKKLGKDYVIFSNVPEDTAKNVSDIYTEGTCELSDGSLMAFQQSTAADNVAPDAPCEEFYYLYGMSKDGEFGWYVYDASNGTVQRSVANMSYQVPGSSGESIVEKETVNVNSTVRMIFGILSVVCILLLVLVIVLSVRCRRLAAYADGDTDDDDAQNDVEKLSGARREKPERSGVQNGRRRRKDVGTDKTTEVEIPGGTVDLLDLDAEEQAEYDAAPPLDGDDDLRAENTPEDEKEFENLSAMLQKNLEKEFSNADDEPEFYDDEEEAPKQPEPVKKESEPEPDDDLEFL